MPERCELMLGDQQLQLLPQRALWWPARQTLVVADVHLHKDHARRRRGLALPQGAQDEDLAKLDTLLAQTGARQLLVLGDLLHEAPQPDHAGWRGIHDWRARHASLRMLLLPGNHDRQAAQIAALFDAECLDDATVLDGLALHHAPPDDVSMPSLAGHLHPVLQIAAGARQRLRAPVFWLRGQRLVLPAFGALTGGWPIPHRPRDRCFIADAREVFEWPAPR